ncbi:MAG: hypothetical protein P8P30_07830 [Rickettsiales bacterium]|nr:hypothetical protein [Rickettsiales bacterium]
MVMNYQEFNAIFSPPAEITANTVKANEVEASTATPEIVETDAVAADAAAKEKKIPKRTEAQKIQDDIKHHAEAVLIGEFFHLKESTVTATNELPDKDLLNLVKQLSQLGTIARNVGTNEPTTHKIMEQIGAEIATKGITFKEALATIEEIPNHDVYGAPDAKAEILDQFREKAKSGGGPSL